MGCTIYVCMRSIFRHLLRINACPYSTRPPTTVARVSEQFHEVRLYYPQYERHHLQLVLVVGAFADWRGNGGAALLVMRVGIQLRLITCEFMRA